VRRLRFNWTKAPDVFRSLYNNPLVERYMTAYLHELQPDVVHITSCYALSGSVITAARRAGIPTVLTATDFWFLCARNTLLKSDGTLCSGPESTAKCAQCMLADAKLYRWPRKVLPEPIVVGALERAGRHPVITRQRGVRGMLGDWQDRFSYLSQALESVDHIVTASRFLRELFVTYGVPAEKITHSPYGLDTSWARGFDAKTSSDRLRIGFIGQLIPIKGPDVLLRAVALLPNDAPLEVKIYGELDKDPAYGQQLRALAEGDDRVAFPGSFDNSRMGAVLSEIDVLAVPSTWYDFPLVIPSAFATRTPVIASDLPGMNELVSDGVNGLLFEHHDHRALAHRLERCLSEPGLLGALRAGIAPVKTVERMTAEYLDLYGDLGTNAKAFAMQAAH
jgi:glycosyltransferase involved in cell wall biosynthesis